MKIRFQLPATVATWHEETPQEGYATAYYSRCQLSPGVSR